MTTPQVVFWPLLLLMLLLKLIFFLFFFNLHESDINLDVTITHFGNLLIPCGHMASWVITTNKHQSRSRCQVPDCQIICETHVSAQESAFTFSIDTSHRRLITCVAGLIYNIQNK